jgi:steroid delta-isomerase-like uncharacterized protein
MRFILAAVMTVTMGVWLCSNSYASAAENVRIAKRVFLEAMGQGDFDEVESVYAREFVAHAAERDYTLQENTAAEKSWRVALPDLKVTVERTVADRDLVAVHWKGVGTNTVAAGGMPGDGKKLSLEGMTFFRFASGHIAEEWSILDVATFRKQLN